MELDIEVDLEGKLTKGPCPFPKEKEGLFFCDIRVDSCGYDDSVPSKCTKYWMLGEGLIDYVRAETRAGCAKCGRVEINDFWFQREEIFIPDIKDLIPLDIWQKLWDLLGKCFCTDCRPKKPKSRKKREKDKVKGGLS